MSEAGPQQWIEKTLLPRLVDVVDEWRGASIAHHEVKSMGSMKDNFTTYLFLANVTLSDSDNREKRHNLIIKIMMDNPQVRLTMLSDQQFANEIHMYTTIVPMFVALARKFSLVHDPSSWLPKHYYSSVRESKDKCSEEDGIVVLENLAPKGFKLGDRASLDFNHLMLALEQLGRFHAMSYALKLKDEQAFQRDVVSKIQETMFCAAARKQNEITFKACTARLLAAMEGETGEGVARLRARLADPFTLMEDLIVPREPLAVLCHGDFLRNNMLFRYSDDGKPCEVKFIDFQVIRYASPAIDLALLLFMNATAELREKRWDDLLRGYHCALISTLKALGVAEPARTFGLEALLEDLRVHALQGFIISVCFLPWMLADEDDLDDLTRIWQEDPTSAEYEARCWTVGGDGVTAVLVDLAKEMIARGLV